jgi:hypothetical protein
MELCLAQLPVTGAGITVMADADRQQPLWASDGVAARVDELQFRLGQGPCVDAFTSCSTVMVADLRDTSDTRWPVFAAAARETPARGIVALPLHVGDTRVGIIDFYRDWPGLLDAADLAAAQRAADAVFWSLLGLHAARSLDGESTPGDVDGGELDPHGWLAGRPAEHGEVYQATGMVLAQLGVSAGSALARLRAYAFVHDRPINEVAHDVVARRLRFSEGEDS